MTIAQNGTSIHFTLRCQINNIYDGVSRKFSVIVQLTIPTTGHVGHNGMQNIKSSLNT